MTPILEISNLFKNYGAIEVLKAVTFDVTPGETLAVIGPNGAGKTTLFKSLSGEVFPDRGKVLYAGADITRHSASWRVNNGIGRTFQVARVFPNLTTLENICVALEAQSRAEREHIFGGRTLRPAGRIMRDAASGANAVGLESKHDHLSRFLSHGDRKRLEIAIALALKPRILLLDEPTAGMSPFDREQTVDLIARVRADTGLTVVLTEHDMDVVFGLAGRIMVLNYGEIVTIGSPDEVRGNTAVRDIYLGREMASA